MQEKIMQTCIANSERKRSEIEHFSVLNKQIISQNSTGSVVIVSCQ